MIHHCRRSILLWLLLMKKRRIDLRRRSSLLTVLLLKRRKCRRRIWVHEFNRQRKQQGDFHKLFQELRKDDERFAKVSRGESSSVYYLKRCFNLQ